MNSELFPPGLASHSSKRKWLTLIGGATLITTLISLVLILSLTQLREAKHDETRQYLDAIPRYSIDLSIITLMP